MCGICGIINFSQNSKIDKDLIEKMSSKMVHRGPDEGETYINNNGSPAVGLGHRRLKIIDLSKSARQPMSNEDKSIWLVFNGEIYNFLELRKILEAKGHKFSSHSDTETIIHLYEEEGVDCIKKLRGMFALAIWDSNEKTLLLARDRFGKKPLLYSHKNNAFSFASEFESLLTAVSVSNDINLTAIPDYITFGYIPAPETIYKEITKLLPGHILIFKNDQIQIKPYWQLDYTKKINISFQDATEKTLDLLEDAVRVRLYSDVPLGAFLSGGTDSSAVVALMAKLSKSIKVKTFSIGFDDKNFDELRYAKLIANRFDTEHHEFIVRPEALKILPELIERYGEPYADSSCIPTYYVAKMTRQYVTVALNGDGGDELFAGYERYKAIYLSRLYNRIPAFLRKGALEPIINNAPVSLNGKTKINRMKRFLKGVNLPILQRYLRWIAVFDMELQKKLYSDDFHSRINTVSAEKLLLPYFNHRGSESLIDILLSADTNTYLPNDLLVKMDIATMANSLEARSPFLDHNLAEFVASLNGNFKMRFFINKYLLKKSIKNLIPRENIHRPKMGFGAPIGRWFRNELKEFLKETLLSQKSLNRGYFNQEFIKNVVKQHIDQKADYSYQLWSLLMLELWHKRFIDKDA